MTLGALTGAALTGGLVLAVAGVVRGDAPTEALPPPVYVNESATSGLEHIYDGDFEYFVGGGVAVFDCDADGDPDLYLAGGTEAAGLYRNESSPGGDIRFELLDSVPALTGVTGAYPLDYDSDGHPDLAVLRVGSNEILRGQGDCRFERVGEALGVSMSEQWTAAFAATWEPGQELPTMVFANYLDLGRLAEDERTCDRHQLFRGQAGTYQTPITLEPGWCALSALFSDWDRSGRRDLRLTNDRHYYEDGQEQLWRIEPEETPRPFTAAEGWESMQIWGMGIASHDLTGDGKPEVFLTSQGDNKLQTLSGGDGPTYEDIALQVGVNAHRPFVGDSSRPSTAWHAEFDDVNNDGFIDLFVTKGNVEAMPEFAVEDPNNLLLGGPDGTFAESAAEANLLDLYRSRGGAVTDLNQDGKLDVVVVERRRPAQVWRNVGEEVGNWLAVELSQPPPNQHAIGAWIEVRIGNHTIEREVTIGGGHAGGELGPVHFGLAKATSARVRVQWPDGSAGPWQTFDANQTITVEKPRT
jgi:enediyne biosynthesis protein E4